MGERGGELDLAEEALAAERRGEVLVEDLDGDVAVVLEVVGEVDGRHAAGAELALDAVAIVEGGCEQSGGVVAHVATVGEGRRERKGDLAGAQLQ